MTLTSINVRVLWATLVHDLFHDLFLTLSEEGFFQMSKICRGLSFNHWPVCGSYLRTNTMCLNIVDSWCTSERLSIKLPLLAGLDVPLVTEAKYRFRLEINIESFHSKNNRKGKYCFRCKRMYNKN